MIYIILLYQKTRSYILLQCIYRQGVQNYCNHIKKQGDILLKTEIFIPLNCIRKGDDIYHHINGKTR